jgi:hypothetical protein
VQSPSPGNAGDGGGGGQVLIYTRA